MATWKLCHVVFQLQMSLEILSTLTLHGGYPTRNLVAAPWVSKI